MPRITVAKLAFNERSDATMWDHGVEFDRLPALLENQHVITRNRKGRAADLLLIGRDNSGRCIVAPIVPTADPLVWRPVTAWPCKPSEEAMLRQRRSIMDAAVRYHTSQEPLDDEERELMDPDTWDWASTVEGVPTPNDGLILEVEFTREEIGPLQRLAHANGMTAHAFIKQTALDRVSREAPSEPIVQSAGRRRQDGMTGRIRSESTQEPLDDEERELMNPEHWDWETIAEGVIMPNVGAILPIRFTREEIGPLQRLAHSESVTTHEFIKQAALARLPQEARR